MTDQDPSSPPEPVSAQPSPPRGNRVLLDVYRENGMPYRVYNGETFVPTSANPNQAPENPFSTTTPQVQFPDMTPIFTELGRDPDPAVPRLVFQQPRPVQIPPLIPFSPPQTFHPPAPLHPSTSTPIPRPQLLTNPVLRARNYVSPYPQQKPQQKPQLRPTGKERLDLRTWKCPYCTQWLNPKSRYTHCRNFHDGADSSLDVGFEAAKRARGESVGGGGAAATTGFAGVGGVGGAVIADSATSQFIPDFPGQSSMGIDSQVQTKPADQTETDVQNEDKMDIDPDLLNQSTTQIEPEPQIDPRLLEDHLQQEIQQQNTQQQNPF